MRHKGVLEKEMADAAAARQAENTRRRARYREILVCEAQFYFVFGLLLAHLFYMMAGIMEASLLLIGAVVSLSVAAARGLEFLLRRYGAVYDLDK